MRFSGIHLSVILLGVPKLLFSILSLKTILLKLLQHLRGANELNSCYIGPYLRKLWLCCILKSLYYQNACTMHILRIREKDLGARGCLTNILQALQNNLAKIHNVENHIFKLKLCTCAQSMALGTRTKFQLEVLIRCTISAIHKFQENIFNRIAHETLVKQASGLWSTTQSHDSLMPVKLLNKVYGTIWVCHKSPKLWKYSLNAKLTFLTFWTILSM